MQRLLSYLRYLSYFHFNPLLGIASLTDEIRGEKKYGLHTSGFEPINRQGLRGPALHFGYSYLPSNYVLLERMLAKRNLWPHNGSFLDMGCGKGRVMAVAAHFGFTSITGIDIIPKLIGEAQQQLDQQKGRFPSATFQVSTQDARTFAIPDDCETIFLYNPFRQPVMEKVVANMLQSFQRQARPLFVLYFNPTLRHLFLNASFIEVYHTSRFGRLEAVLLRIG